MENIKTQNIPHEIYTHSNEGRATPELSKESFLEAFTNAHKNKEGVGEKETVEDLEDLEVDDAERALILWFPNTPIMENKVSVTSPKIVPEFGEVIVEEISTNELEEPQANEVLPFKDLNLVEDATKESFETLIGQEILEPLIEEASTATSKSGVENEVDVKHEKVVSQTAETLKQISIASEEKTKKALEQQSTEKVQTSNIDQKTSEISQTLQNFIEWQTEVRETPSTSSMTEFSNTLKLEKTKFEQRLSTKSQQMMHQDVEVEVEKLSTVEEKIIQVENTSPNTDEIEIIASEEPNVETELANPVSQLTQFKSTTVNLETQKVVSVPTEQWVSQVESIVLDQMDSNNTGEKMVTARLQLTPKKLGEMDIELVIQNKELTAKIVVEHAETKEWLEQKMHQLNATLATQDIQVDDFQIVVAKQTQEMSDTGVQDNPFFGKKDQEAKREKTINQPVEEEQPKEKEYKITNSNTKNGRLSLWV